MSVLKWCLIAIILCVLEVYGAHVRVGRSRGKTNSELLSSQSSENKIGQTTSELLASGIVDTIKGIFEAKTPSADAVIEKKVLPHPLASDGVTLKLKAMPGSDAWSSYELFVESPPGAECFHWLVYLNEKIYFSASGSLNSDDGVPCSIKGTSMRSNVSLSLTHPPTHTHIIVDSSPTKLRWPLAKEMSTKMKINRWQNKDEGTLLFDVLLHDMRSYANTLHTHHTAYPNCRYRDEDENIKVYTQYTENPDHKFINSLCRSTGLMSVLEIMKYGKPFYDRRGGMKYTTGWLAREGGGAQDETKILRLSNFANRATLQDCFNTCNNPLYEDILTPAGGAMCRKPSRTRRTDDAAAAFQRFFISVDGATSGDTLKTFLTSRHGKESIIGVKDTEEDCRQLEAAFTCLKVNAILAVTQNNVLKAKRVNEDGLGGSTENSDVAAFIRRSS